MTPSVQNVRRDLDREIERLRLELPPVSETLSRPVRAILEYARNHLFEPGLNVSVARIECGVRDNNVSSLFRHELGCSIKEYIETMRMTAANELLQDHRFSVFEIAQCLGYVHPQTFYRVYRRHFGCAPATCRRAA